MPSSEDYYYSHSSLPQPTAASIRLQLRTRPTLRRERRALLPLADLEAFEFK
jgi:hypothetical protein